MGKPDRRFLKIWRIQHRMLGKELATALGISRVHYNQIELGNYNPSDELASKIAKITGLDFERIKLGDGKEGL